MTTLPTQDPSWQSRFAPVLAALGQGLMSAGAPGGGWRAFGPGLMEGFSNFQQMQDARTNQEMRQQQFQWQQEQAERARTAEQERIKREQDYNNFLDELAGGSGLNGGSAGAQQGAGGPGVPPPVRQVGNYGAAVGGALQPGMMTPQPNLPPDSLFNPNGTGWTPQQIQALRFLGPDAGREVMAQRAFAEPKPRRTMEIAGRLVDADTGEVIKDLSAEEIALRQASRPLTNINMPGNPTPDERGAGAFAEANAKSQAAYFDNVATAGAQAQTRMGDVDQLIRLIETTPQGAGQDWINKGAAIASRFGIDAGEYANVPAAQAFQSIVSRLAPTLRVAGSGATSDFEMQQFLQSLPAISNMPDGNRIIASNLKRIAERSIAEANIAVKVQGGDLTPAQGRKAILDLGSLNLDLPSFSQTPPAGGPGGAPGSPAPALGTNPNDPLNLFPQQ